MKVLLLPDKKNWAFFTICEAIVKYNDTDIEFTVMPIKGGEKKIKKEYKKYDLFFVLGWQTYDRIGFLPKKQTLIGLHSYHSWDKHKTTPDNKEDMVPPRKLVDFLNKFLRVNAVSKQLTHVFEKAGVDKIYYTPNGADTDIFFPDRKHKNKKFTIGYSGSKAHDWRKGVTEFIYPAAKKAKVDVKIAMLSSDQYVDLDHMPEFYNTLDTYICASSSEGFSLSVLEAAACGLPIISTKVGGCVDLIEDGLNGFLVDRNINAIADSIVLLRDNESLRHGISNQIGSDVVCKWAWSNRSVDWINFIGGRL